MGFFMKLKLLILSASLLSGAIALQITASMRGASAVMHPDLISRLPTEPTGWEVVDHSIADTPEMKRAVDEMLNYSDAIFREYKKEGRRLAVYVAYWKPRKFHPRMIAMHTPDICWVGNGWKMGAEDYEYKLQHEGLPLLPAQYREFITDSERTYVVYWHTVNGNLSGYAMGPKSRSYGFVDNLLHDLRSALGEQYFIRISSNKPWSEWIGDPLFESVLSVFNPVLSEPSQ